MNLELIYDFTNRLQAISSRNDKESFIKQYKDNVDVKEFLVYVLNPLQVYGIKTSKLNKFMNKDNGTSKFNSLSECFNYLVDNNTGRDVDVNYVVSFINSQDEKYKQFLIECITKSLKLGVQPKSINKAIGKNLFEEFEVQRGKSFSDYETKVAKKEKSISEKRNGIRCITYVYQGEKVINKSRQNQVINGLELIKADMINLPSGVYEGELTPKDSHKYKLREVLQETIKIVNSDMELKEVNYEIFDYLTFEEFNGDVKSRKFFERRDANPVNNLQSDHVFMIPELYRGKDNNEIYKLLDEVVDNGGEGLMCNLDEPYKKGKTHAILKVKKKYSSDLKITGFEEGNGKYKGKLGALVLDYKGFKLKASGMSDELRQEIWNNQDKYLGVIAEIEHEQETSNEKGGLSLEYPNFVQFRFDKEEVSYAHE